jgi:hypothetical protein
MIQSGTIIGGIPIPSTAPWFLGTVAVHVAAGLVATAAGATAMLSPKAPGRHPLAGTTYFWGLVVANVTMSALAIAQWPADNHLAVLGFLSLVSATLGRAARRAGRPGWQPRHIVLMGTSYVLMLTAFYVDNGPHLPLWDRLPSVAYWLLPSVVGVPIIAKAVQRRLTSG